MINSISLYTEEIDDFEVMYNDIKAEAGDFEFKKNSMAIVFAEEETDYQGLYSELRKHWDFPIIGCTAMSMLVGKHGYCGNGVSFLILTSDDCEFSTGIVENVGDEDYEKRVKDKYQELKSALMLEPKVVICYGSVVAGVDVISAEDSHRAVCDACEGLPVFGGMASDSFSFSNFKVFYNETEALHAQVMALVAGNCKPRFVSVNSVKNKATFSYEISKSEGNKVYRLGNNTFIDVMKRENMFVEKEDVNYDYILSPIVLTIKQSDGNYVTVARNLTNYNLEEGSAIFMGNMPEGSLLSIGLIQKEDVQASVDKALHDILSGIIYDADSEYHTLLCTSCCARFIALASDIDAEARAYSGALDENMSLAGFYSFGEYCPVKGETGDNLYNMFHNFTFAIMAL